MSTTLTIRVLPAGMELYFDGSHPVTIGRDAAAHVLVRDGATSPEHAVLRLEKGRWVFEDRSVNGTYLDGSQIPSRLPLDRAVTLALGSAANGAQLRIIPPGRSGEPSPHVPEEPSFAPGQLPPGRYSGSYRMASSRIRIGRGLDNEIVLDDLLVSRYHAELRATAGGLEIVDLGTRGGTFVNGRPIDRRALLSEGSLVGVGHTLLRLRGGALEKYSNTGISFAAVDLSVVAGKRTVLDDLSFPVSGGQFAAVLGPAGSGKSALLRALAGQRRPDRGAVRYNGRDLYRDYAELSSRIGFVPQGDTLHAKLTVRSVLEYAARLRFPTDASAGERTDRVDEVLSETGLSKSADVRVERLPGGLRKRTSVAIELLAQPTLLLLDEPTSGLDPGDQQGMMELLRKLADNKRTVIAVTRSVQDLHMCDRLLFLAPGGQIAYFGSPEQALGFFRQPDYPHVFQYLDQVVPGEAKQRFVSSAQAQEFVNGPLAGLRTDEWPPVAATKAARKGPLEPADQAQPTDSKPKPGSKPRANSKSGSRAGLKAATPEDKAGTESAVTTTAAPANVPAPAAPAAPAAPPATSTAAPKSGRKEKRENWSRSPYSTRQLITLTRRCIALTFANKRSTLLNFAQAPVLGLLMLATFGVGDLKPGTAGAAADSATVLLLLTLGATYLGAAASIREIAKDRAVLARERADGLSVWAYALSKALVLGIVTIVECFAMTYVALLRQGRPAHGVALANGELELALVLSLTGLAGMALGLLISALARNGDQVLAALPVLLFVQFALSGAALPVTTVPGLNQVSHLASARWGYSAAAGTVRLDELLGDGCNGSPIPGKSQPASTTSSTASTGSTGSLRPTTVCDPAHASTTTTWARDLGILAGVGIIAIFAAGLATRPIGRPRRR